MDDNDVDVGDEAGELVALDVSAGEVCTGETVHREIHYLNEEVLNSFSDIQIISVEGEVVFTNRLALASCSSFLRKILEDMESSGCLATETDVIISTNISIESINAVLDFVTRGIIPIPDRYNREESKIDPDLMADLQAFGLDLGSLELVVAEGDSHKDYRKGLKGRGEQIVNDQTRIVRLDWDILGAALHSIGGIDAQHAGAVELVSIDGETQQIYLQPDGTASLVSHMPGGNEIIVDDNVLVREGPSSRSLDDYSAASAKMRRILKTSKLLPHKRHLEMETTFSTGRSRGRPRRDEVRATKRPFASAFMKEDEKENSSRSDIIERPGRRPVKKPKRFDELLDHIKVETHDDVLYDPEDMVEGEQDIMMQEDGMLRQTIKRSPKPKKPRAPSASQKDSLKWQTCVACGKICKSKYLFKVHQKNYGPYHDNTCAICGEEFKSWENHIAHLREQHNGEYKYKCGLCPLVFETEERQRIHRHEIHTRRNKDKTACEKCGKVVIDYVAHQENFHGTEELPCPSCPRVFGHPMALKRHVKDNHRQFPCEHCGNIMKNFKKYRLHILSVHTPDNLKPYQCQICIPSRGFATKWSLFEHMNKHNNMRPFKCKACPATFSTTSSKCHHEKACTGNKGMKMKPTI